MDPMNITDITDINIKITALNNVLKKYKLSNDKIEEIKKDFYNFLINE
jgi:hypothetical protein